MPYFFSLKEKKYAKKEFWQKEIGPSAHRLTSQPISFCVCKKFLVPRNFSWLAFGSPFGGIIAICSKSPHPFGMNHRFAMRCFFETSHRTHQSDSAFILFEKESASYLGLLLSFSKWKPHRFAAIEDRSPPSAGGRRSRLAFGNGASSESKRAKLFEIGKEKNQRGVPPLILFRFLLVFPVYTHAVVFLHSIGVLGLFKIAFCTLFCSSMLGPAHVAFLHSALLF